MNRATEHHRAPLRRRGATTIRWSPLLHAPRRAVAPGQRPQPPGPPAPGRGRRPVSGTRAESRARVGASPLCGSHERDRRPAPLGAGPSGRLRDPGRGLRSGRSARIRAGARTGPPSCAPRAGPSAHRRDNRPRALPRWPPSPVRQPGDGVAAPWPRLGGGSSPGYPAPSAAPVPYGDTRLRPEARAGASAFPGAPGPQRRCSGRGGSPRAGGAGAATPPELGPRPLRPGHGARSRRRRTARQPPPGHAPHTPLAPLPGGAGAGRVRARVSLAGCGGGWPSGVG